MLLFTAADRSPTQRGWHSATPLPGLPVPPTTKHSAGGTTKPPQPPPHCQPSLGCRPSRRGPEGRSRPPRPAQGSPGGAVLSGTALICLLGFPFPARRRQDPGGSGAVPGALKEGRADCGLWLPPAREGLGGGGRAQLWQERAREGRKAGRRRCRGCVRCAQVSARAGGGCVVRVPSACGRAADGWGGAGPCRVVPCRAVPRW